MSRTYYKATRMDGRDFRTGTVDYAAALTTGVPVMHPDPDLKADASRYLSVATVPTDCTGFSWPCRLFAVEAVGQPRKDAQFPNKRRVRGVRVVAERPAREVFGPNGVAVVAVIERASRLTGDEVRRLAAAWDAAWAAAWDAARGAAWDAAWAAARDAAWDAAQGAARAAARGAAWDAAWAAAWAAAGELASDLITAEQYDLFTGPWRSVVGSAS